MVIIAQKLAKGKRKIIFKFILHCGEKCGIIVHVINFHIYMQRLNLLSSHLVANSTSLLSPNAVIDKDDKQIRKIARDESIAELNNFVQKNFSGTQIFPSFENPVYGKVGLFHIPNDKTSIEEMLPKFMLLPEIANSSALIEKFQEKPDELKKLFTKFGYGQYYIVAAIDKSKQMTKFLGLCGVIASTEAVEQSDNGKLNVGEMVMYIEKDSARNKVTSQTTDLLQRLTFNSGLDKIIYTAKKDNPSIEIIKTLVGYNERDKSSHGILDSNGYIHFSIDKEKFALYDGIIKASVQKSINNMKTNVKKLNL